MGAARPLDMRQDFPSKGGKPETNQVIDFEEGRGLDNTIDHLPAPAHRPCLTDSSCYKKFACSPAACTKLEYGGEGPAVLAA